MTTRKFSNCERNLKYDSKERKCFKNYTYYRTDTNKYASNVEVMPILTDIIYKVLIGGRTLSTQT